MRGEAGKLKDDRHLLVRISNSHFSCFQTQTEALVLSALVVEFNHRPLQLHRLYLCIEHCLILTTELAALHRISTV